MGSLSFSPPPPPPPPTQVEVTRFEDLEEVHAEVKLKQTLWHSQRDWDHDSEEWNTVGMPRSDTQSRATPTSPHNSIIKAHCIAVFLFHYLNRI